MKDEHTPGPWSTARIGKDFKHVWIHSDEKVTVFDSSEPETWPMTEADAQLIAAAPEMLQSLRVMMLGVDEYWAEANPEHMQAASDAIASATNPATRRD
jgi:hypothetical protein